MFSIVRSDSLNGKELALQTKDLRSSPNFGKLSLSWKNSTRMITLPISVIVLKNNNGKSIFGQNTSNFWSVQNTSRVTHKKRHKCE